MPGLSLCFQFSHSTAASGESDFLEAWGSRHQCPCDPASEVTQYDCATYWLKQSQAHLDFKEGNKEFWSHVFKLPQLLLFSELYKSPLAQKVSSMLSSLPICLVVSVAHDSCWLRVCDLCELMCLWMGTQGDKPVTTSMLSLYVCFCLRMRMSGCVPSLSPFQNS